MAVNRNMHFFQDTVVRGAGKWHDERGQISSKPIDIVLGGHQHDKHSSNMLTNQAESISQSSKKASTFKSGLSETIRFFENPSPSSYECSTLVKPKMVKPDSKISSHHDEMPQSLKKVSNLKKSAAASSEMVPFEKLSSEHLNIDQENLTPARPNMVKSGLIINSYHDEICYTKSLAINEQDETNAHLSMKTDLNTSITSTKTSRPFKNTSIRTFHDKFEHANGDFSGNLKRSNQPTRNFSGNSDHDNQWAGNSERSSKPASSLVKTGLVIDDHSKDIYPSKKSEVEAELGTSSQSSKASTLHKPTASAQTNGSFSISSGSNLSFGSDRSTQTSPSLVKSDSIDDHCGDNYFIKKAAFTDQVETTPQATNGSSNLNTTTASSKTSRFLGNSYVGNLCSETQTTPSLPKSSCVIGGQCEEKHYLKKPMMQEQVETTPQATNWPSNWNTTTASSQTSRFLEDSLVENLSISSEAQTTPSLPKSSIEIGGQCEEKKRYFKKPMMQEQETSAKDTSKWNTSTASSHTSRFFDNTSVGSLGINSKCSTHMSPSLVKSGLIIGGHCEDNHYNKKSASEEQTKFGPRVFNLNVVRGGVRDVWKLKAYIAKPDGSKEVVRVADNRDGTINIHYRPNEPGEHHLYILHNNVNMLGSPIDFVVMSENDGHYSVFGDGLKRARVGEPARFTICTGGWLDNRLAIIVEGKSKVHLDRRDNHDGTIDVIWIAEEPGEYKISLKLAGQHLKGSPFIAHVSA